MLLVWMSLVGFSILTVVLPSPTTSLSSKELCNELQGAKLSVLAMGVVSDSPGSPDSLWILVEGGYLFALPTTNLKIKFAENWAKLVIDQEMIRPDKLYNQAHSDFTFKSSHNRDNRFFFISSKKKYGLLGRMSQFASNKKVELQTYYINNGSSNQISKFNHKSAIAFVATGLAEEGSSIAFAYQLAFDTETLRFGIKNTFTLMMQTDTVVDMRPGPYHELSTSHLTFSRKFNFTSGFFFQSGNEHYLIVLDDLLMTIGVMHDRDNRVQMEYGQKFQTSLGDLLECRYAYPEPPRDMMRPAESKAITGKPVMWYQKTTESNRDNELIWICCILVALVFFVGGSFYWWRLRGGKRKKDKEDKKNKKKNGSGIPSGLSSKDLNFARFSQDNAESMSVLSNRNASGVQSSNLSSYDGAKEDKAEDKVKKMTTNNHKNKSRIDKNKSRIRTNNEEISEQTEDVSETAVVQSDDKELSQDFQLDESQSKEVKPEEDSIEQKKDLEEHSKSENSICGVETKVDKIPDENDEDKLQVDQVEPSEHRAAEPGTKKRKDDSEWNL